MRFFKKLCIYMLALTIMILIKTDSLYSWDFNDGIIKETILENQKTDLTGDGILDTYIVIERTWISADKIGWNTWTCIKVFDGTTGKNIFPDYYFGHFGVQRATYTYHKETDTLEYIYDYEIVNNNIIAILIRGNPSYGFSDCLPWAIISYKYYPEFKMFMEYKYISLTSDVRWNTDRDVLFSLVEGESAYQLKSIRMVRKFFYYVENKQDQEAKNLLDTKYLNWAWYDIDSEDIYSHITNLFRANNNQYQTYTIKYEGQGPMIVSIRFPIGDKTIANRDGLGIYQDDGAIIIDFIIENNKIIFWPPY